MDRGLLAILLASLVVQGLVLSRVHDKPCRADECRYLHCARSILTGEGWDYYPPDARTIGRSLRRWDAGHTPPLYVLFISAHIVVFGGEAWPTKLTQILMVMAMAWLAYRVARGAWGRRAGLWAAALVAFYPNLIAYAHYNYSEVVFSFFLLLALALVLAAVRGEEKAELRTLVLAGVAFGLATLTREITLYLAPLAAIWIAMRPPWNIRRASIRFAALTVPSVVLIAPWTAFNAYRFNDYLLLSTNAGNVLYKNQNAQAPENHDWGAGRLRPRRYPERSRRRCRILDPVENYRCEVRNAMDYMVRYPERVAARAVPKLQGLVNPASFPVRSLRRGIYGPVEDRTIQAVTLLTAGSFIAITLLGVVALWLGPPGDERSLTAVVLLFFLAVFAVTFGMSRYRIPLMPLLAIQAASILADPRRLLAGVPSPLRWIGLALTIAFIGVAWAMYLPLIADVF